MLKKILAVLAMLYAAASFAAVDVNTAKQADLDGIKGIGPAMSKRILDERKKGKFKSWEDLISRVKGVGDATATKFSDDGLTVNGETFKPSATAAKDDKKDTKAAAKDDKKDAKPVAREEKKDTKAAAKEEKKDEKTAKAAAPAASAASGAKK